MLAVYLKRCDIDLSSELFLCHPIVGSKVKLRDAGHLTYTRLRKLLKEKHNELGYPSVDFGIHTLRTKGVTAAAVNDVLDRLLKNMVVGVQRLQKMAT